MSESEQKTVKVTLTVPVSDADGYGGAHAAGDTIEVPADVAERLVAAGMATLGDAKPAEEAPAEKPPGGATGRRSSS